MEASLFDHYAASAAESYERYFVPSIGLPFARCLVEAAGIESGERVLDVACGTGVATRLAAGAAGSAARVAGLDANPGMLEVARSHPSTPGSIEWYEGNAEEMPLDDGVFDVVVCSLGFQFFADKVKALREMRRVLAPGGRAVLATSGPTPPLFGAIDGALREHIGPQASRFVAAVFSLHDPAEVRSLLDDAGFADVEVASGSVPVRLAPPADFFWQYVHSTPLAVMAGQLGEAERAALERDVVERSAPFSDGDGMRMEPGLLIAAGRRAAG